MSKKKKEEKIIQDNIIPVDFKTTYDDNMARYSLYVIYQRYFPNIYDGLKPVQRRVLYAMWDKGWISNATKRKSANTVGETMAKYHPHGDASIYEAMKTMTNWFEIKEPLIIYDSNSGSMQGGPQAAMRYTESYLSRFALECLFDDFKDGKQVVDWHKTFDNHAYEPFNLPVRVPLLLINGCFAIAIGHKIGVPKHSINDVIDVTLKLIDNPKAKFILIPDPCHKCEIIDTDWMKICNTGFGYYCQRGIVEIESLPNGKSILHIKSVPDYVYPNTIIEKIEELIKGNKIVGIEDIQDHSTSTQLDIHLIMKKGVDPNYIKQILYSNNNLLQRKDRVNMQVIDGTTAKRVSYRTYLLSFIEYRRNIKFRAYNARLQKIETRMHEVDAYIKILESGDVDGVIKMIRNNKSSEEAELIQWLMKKINVTDLQAKFILHTELKNLSKGYYNKYKEEFNNLKLAETNCIEMVINPILIDNEIRNELLDIRNKYGSPRRSILISESQAKDIPEGVFNIIITVNNYIKKIPTNEVFKPYRGDRAKIIIQGDNSKDIILFDNMGKAFKLPINKVSFTDRNSPGIDIRLLIKKLTSNITSAIYAPLLEEFSEKKIKYYLVSLSKSGLIKKIDIDDVLTATSSGIIYSRINHDDEIISINIANDKDEIVVYTRNKALKISMQNIPYLKRATLGNISIKSTLPVEGMSTINGNDDILIITKNGKINKIHSAALPLSSRNKAGNSVIKLSKGDYICKIIPCLANNINILKTDGITEVIDITNIPIGSSLSTGVKICKEGIINATY